MKNHLFRVSHDCPPTRLRFCIYSTCQSDYIPYFALVGAPQRPPQGYQGRSAGHDVPEPHAAWQRLGDTSGGGRDHYSDHYLRIRCISTLCCDEKVRRSCLGMPQSLRQALHGSILMAVSTTRYAHAAPANGSSHDFISENGMHAWLRKQLHHRTSRYSGLQAAFRAAEMITEDRCEDGYAGRRGLCVQSAPRGACMPFSEIKS